MRTEFILSGMNCAKGMVGRYRASQLASRYQVAWRVATRQVIVRAVASHSAGGMVPSPQVPTRESRGDGGDVPKTCWQEDNFNVALASQSALGWGLSRGGQSVRAWLGTVAMWRVSPRLIKDCHEVACQSALGWGLRLSGESVRA
ncbi:hypothetical protein ACLB2K_076962 [Fragaria x ananassa]